MDDAPCLTGLSEITVCVHKYNFHYYYFMRKFGSSGEKIL